MKVSIKTIWSTFFSYLLLLLVLMLFGFGFVTAKPWPLKLATAGGGLYFLITFIGATWPDRPGANKLVKVLNLCAGGLLTVAMLLVLQHYLKTVPMT